MSEIVLHPHQAYSIEELNRIFEERQRILLQLPTGAGKTFVFSFFCKEWSFKHPEAKILILVHRDELLKQSARSLRKIGLTVETLTSNKKELKHLSTVYVAMVETAVNRLKKNPNYFNHINLLIADECHLLLFERVFNSFPNRKILGVTATPMSYKKINFCKCVRCGRNSEKIEICCGIEMYEYVRSFHFSEIYDEIISPVQVKELMDLGLLVPEYNFSTGNVDRSKLTIDSKTGDFDRKSSDEEFGSGGAVVDVVRNYESICKGKKTLIFNNSTSTNLLVYNQFIESGYSNVKMLDSVNKHEGRSKTLDWFKNTPDGILLNCGILTAGFDQDDIEAIIMNRATTSLMLYIQIAGRGARTTDVIFKDKFLFIDLGGNIEVHGKFSDFIDWKSIFYGTDKKPRPKKEALENTTMCENCGGIFARNLPKCDICDHEVEVFKREKKLILSNEIAKPMDDYPLPNGRSISDYCIKNGKDMNFAYTVLINHCVDLFIFKNVTVGSYLKSLENGSFYDRLKDITTKPMRYFFISEMVKCRPKSFEQIMKSIKSKLDAHYKLSADQIKQINIIKKV